MKSIDHIKKIALETIQIEHLSIGKLTSYINDDFGKSVKLIYESKGRLIITGMGKSAIIAEKITATLNSTGTPAIFMHAADAIHGDLGIIRSNDVVLCLSKSGNTPEIKVLVPFIKKFGNKIIALVSNTESFLAQQADLIIQATVEKEACPNNLAPTSSTTAQLVMGDALAVSLLDYRSFSSDDFAKYHPGGALGKKLYMRVDDLYKQNSAPKVKTNDFIDKVIIEISASRLGATVVIDNSNIIAGIITDGDLRRMLQNKMSLDKTQAYQIMSKNPKIISPEILAINAFDLMKKNNITQLIVADNDEYKGIIHIHDILKEGVV